MPKLRDPNQVCPPSHKHGLSSTCYYKHKCACKDCLQTKSYMHMCRSRRAARSGIEPGSATVSGDKVSEFLDGYISRGYSMAYLAECSGLPKTTIYKICRGDRNAEPWKRVHLTTWEKIRSADYSQPGSRKSIISAGDSRVRVMHMISLGWSREGIAKASGVSYTTIHCLIHGRITVTSGIADKIERFYSKNVVAGRVGDGPQMTTGLVRAIAALGNTDDDDSIEDTSAEQAAELRIREIINNIENGYPVYVTIDRESDDFNMLSILIAPTGQGEPGYLRRFTSREQYARIYQRWFRCKQGMIGTITLSLEHVELFNKATVQWREDRDNETGMAA